MEHSFRRDLIWSSGNVSFFPIGSVPVMRNLCKLVPNLRDRVCSATMNTATKVLGC